MKYLTFLYHWFAASALSFVTALISAVFIASLPCENCGLGPLIYFFLIFGFWWVFPIIGLALTTAGYVIRR